MLKVTPISDIAYLTESAADAPTAVAYYTDAKSEPPEYGGVLVSWIAKDGSRAAALAVTQAIAGASSKEWTANRCRERQEEKSRNDLTFSAPKCWTAFGLSVIRRDAPFSMRC